MSLYLSAVASFLLSRGPSSRDLRARLLNVCPSLSTSSILGRKLYFQHGLEGLPEKSDLTTPPLGHIEPGIATSSEPPILLTQATVQEWVGNEQRALENSEVKEEAEASQSSHCSSPTRLTVQDGLGSNGQDGPLARWESSRKDAKPQSIQAILPSHLQVPRHTPQPGLFSVFTP